jgi:hypothetical protein
MKKTNSINEERSSWLVTTVVVVVDAADAKNIKAEM